MFWVEIHARLANTALFYCLIMAIWGGWRFLRKQGVGGSYWGAVVIAEVLILAQGLLGGYLWLAGFRPARTIHLLYGIVSAIALPLAYTYTRGRDERPEMLIHTVAFLVLSGLLLRAIGTGGL